MWKYELQELHHRHATNQEASSASRQSSLEAGDQTNKAASDDRYGVALSSSLKLEPFAALFWLSAMHMRIYKLAWGGGVELFL